jgi:hypothetical protein
MASFLNHVAISAPRNGTATHTVSPSSGTVVAGALFTPTVGRYLLVIVEGGATSYGATVGSPAVGWDFLVEVIGNTGLYVWSRTVTGSDAVTVNHNGSGYPIIFDFYEFPAGTTFTGNKNQGSILKAGANPSITGLTGTTFVMAAKDIGIGTVNATATSWSSPNVETLDAYLDPNITDGYYLSVCYQENYTSSSYAPTGTITTVESTTCEAVTWALLVPVLPPPLLAYNFDGSGSTVLDRSGHGRTATLSGGATQTGGQLVIGGTGQALTYTPDAAALPTYASVTLKFTTAGNPGSEIGLWSKMRVTNSSNFNVYIGAASLAAVVRGTTAVGPSIIAPSTGNVGPTLVANTTYTAAVTYDGTTVRMYLNGVQTNTANTASGPLDMTGTNTTWVIGDHPDDTSLTVPTQDFKFEEVRFFDVALTPAQVLLAANTPVGGVTYEKVLDQRVVANGASSGSGDYTSSAFPTQAGSVLVAIIGYGINGSTSGLDYGLPRPVTSGLDWKPRCRRLWAGNFNACTEIWMADNPSGGSKTISQTSADTYWDGSIKDVDVVVLELTGAAAVASQSNPFVVGGRTYGAGVDPGAQSLSLPVDPEATSLVVAATTNFVYSTTAFSITPGADMTEIAEHTNGSNDTNQFVFQAQVRQGSTSKTVAWQDLQAGGSGADTYVWALAAVEFKQGGATPNSQAVRFNGSTSWYTRPAFGFPAATDFTVTFWLKLMGDRNTYSTCVGLRDGSPYAHFGFGSTGDLLGRDLWSGGSNTGFVVPIGRWIYFANTVTVAGTNGLMFWVENEMATANGYGQGTLWNFIGPTADFYIGNDSFNDYFDGSIAAVKIWSSVLTVEELQAEQFSSNPVRTANLFAYYPFNGGPSLLDSGPSSKSLTANGTPTLDTYGPPVVYVPFAGSTYNETGRSVTIASSVASTDLYRFRTGLYTDNFNRADTTPTRSGGYGLNGANLDWDAPDWQISGNKATRIGSSGTDYATFASTLGMSDMFVEADYDRSGGTYCVVNARRPTAANVETGYLGYVDPSGFAHIAKVVAGTFSGIAGGDLAGGPFPTTGRLRLEVVGTLLTLKIDGVTIGSTNDSTITAGNYAGINGSAGCLLDNFAIGGIAQPTVTVLYTPLVQVPLMPMGG